MKNSIQVAFYDAQRYDKEAFEEALRMIALENQFEFRYIEENLSPATAQFAVGCQAVCVFVNDDLSGEVLAVLDELDISLVLLRCAGFDKLDIRSAADLSMSVTRVPAYSPHAVAEYAVGMIMTLNRHIHRAFNRVRDSNFTVSGFVGFDLFGKTVGVIGTGKIGECFVQIMRGFGCNVLLYDKFPKKELITDDKIKYVTLAELFKESDIISLHAPLLPDTRHIINRDTINQMKPGVFLINTSRGALIESRALVDGLICGRIGAAGLDVYEQEAGYFFQDFSDRLIDDHLLARLQNMRNVVLTSHQAFLTKEALMNIATSTIQSLQEYFNEAKSGDHLTNHVELRQHNPAITRALSKRFSKQLSLSKAHTSCDSTEQQTVLSFQG